MVCKATASRPSRGFTLVELMVASGLASLVLLMLAALTYFSGRSFAALTHYIDLDGESRFALDLMMKEIRQVHGVVSCDPHKLVLADNDGALLIYAYLPIIRELRRIKNGYTHVLLEGCDHFTFAVHQRSPKTGGFEQFIASGTNTAKLVHLQWACSREILGTKANTESVHSAKVVIRLK